MENERYLLAKAQGGVALQWVREPLPRPEAGEVRVKIHAAGVAFSDLMRARGLYSGDPQLPFTPGWDLAGEVDQVGAGVAGWHKGQRVVALTSTGNFSRYRTVQAEELIAQPAGLDPAEAVSLCLNYVTAYHLLHRVAHATSGESVLVHSAAGGVGTALLQLGRLAGLKMHGVASRSRLETVTGLGAVAIDRASDDFVRRVRALPGGGADVVLDAVGGETLVRSFHALRPGGRLVWYGMANILDLPARAVPFALARDMMRLWLWKLRPGGRKTRFYSIGTVRHRHPGWIREDLLQLMEWLRDGRISPLIAARLPLAKAPHALELLAQGNARGKIVLMCQE